MVGPCDEGAWIKTTYLAMGQKPVPPVNIRQKWVVHLPRNGTIGFDPQPFLQSPPHPRPPHPDRRVSAKIWSANCHWLPFSQALAWTRRYPFWCSFNWKPGRSHPFLGSRYTYPERLKDPTKAINPKNRCPGLELNSLALKYGVPCL